MLLTDPPPPKPTHTHTHLITYAVVFGHALSSAYHATILRISTTLSFTHGQPLLSASILLTQAGPLQLPVDGSGRWVLLHAGSTIATRNHPQLAACADVWVVSRREPMPRPATLATKGIVGLVLIDALALREPRYFIEHYLTIVNFNNSMGACRLIPRMRF